MSQRYINGIPARHAFKFPHTFLVSDDHQKPDFLEELSGRYETGALLVRSDGWTYSQGPDIVSFMDDRGGIHPRRYVVPIEWNFGGAAEADPTTYPSYMTVCEEGPKITLTFEEFPLIDFTVNNFGTIHMATVRLPEKICPKNTVSFCITLSTGEQIPPLRRMAFLVITPKGSVTIELSFSLTANMTLPQTTITYDTLKP